MSHTTVSRLKELLFEQEARDLDALSRRVEALADDTRLRNADLARRIDHLHERSGSDAQLRASVARVIDGALRDAEVARHRDLADAIAPVVIRSVRAELAAPHTQDQIAGTLYPKMGEMVGRYVASAMRDLMENLNRRLESGLTNNRLMLKLRSLTSGRSMAELALADTQQLEVMEIYLIRRGSGELVHRWEKSDTGSAPGTGDNRDALVSGFLTAITAFAEEAFQTDKSSLRSLDLDDHRIYLRGSPAHLLAAKCRGIAVGPSETLLDRELLRVLEVHQRVETEHAGEPQGRDLARDHHHRLLGELAGRIETEITARLRSDHTSGGMRPLKLMAWVIGMPLLALVVWLGVNRYRTWTVQTAAGAIIERMTELKGYPVTARAEDAGRSLWVVGLTPSAEVRNRLVRELQLISPALKITDTLGVLPQADVGGALRTESIRAALSRVEKRLLALSAELRGATTRVEGEAVPVLTSAHAAVQRSVDELGKLSPDLDDGALLDAAVTMHDRLTAAQAPLAALAGGAVMSDAPASAGDASTGLFDRIAVLSDRLGRLAMTVEQAQRAERERARAIAPLAAEIDALKRRIAALPAPAGPTPRERLMAWARENAIFFSNGLEYRNDSAVQAQLSAAADLIKATSGLVRVVGYTDDAGAPARNAALSLQRAERVADELVARGVARNRLVAVGRGTAVELGAKAGATSPSRRVEFEAGFVGEEASSP